MPSVAHVMENFGAPSEAWLYDLVTSHRHFLPTVLTVEHMNEERFPFGRVAATLPSFRRPSPAWVGWRVRRAVLGDRAAPPNPWRRELRSVEADVFHAHFGPNGWRCVTSGCRPAVTSFYGYDVGRLPRSPIWRAAYRSLFSDGAAFVAEGPYMRSALISMGAPPERTFVVPIIAGALGSERRMRQATAEPRVLMAGRMVPKKGFVYGVKAFAAVAVDHPGAEMVVVGDGPERDSVVAAAKEARMQDKIRFVSFMAREEYLRQMEQADVFLQPSMTTGDGDTEGGAPTTLLDAQASGCIIVTTDHADIPYVVDPNAAYLAKERDLTDLTRTLDRALSEMDEWERRSSDGRLFVESRHSRSVVIDSLERLYASL